MDSGTSEAAGGGGGGLMRACRRRRVFVDLPLDLLLNILSRIPVRWLVRFKCVCKSWYDILTHDSYFIRMHLERSVQSRRYAFLFVLASRIYALDYPSPAAAARARNIDPKFLSELPTHSYTCARIEGHSCNGLFLTYISLRVPGGRRLLYLWNPSTREYKQLPPALTLGPNIQQAHPGRIYGLGYDSIQDDYKVIFGVFYSNIALGYAYANVYSLRTDSVKTIQPTIRLHFGSKCIQGGIFVKDSIHWLFKAIGGMFQMLSFDVTKEDHKPLPLPDVTTNTRAIRNLQAGVLDNCLCLYLLDKMGTIMVFMMNEYGVKESWTKLFILGCYGIPCWYFAALFCNDSDQVTLQISPNPGWGHLVVHKRGVKQVKLVKIHDLPNWFSYEFPIIPYVESLVSLKPATFDAREQ